jgi:hypothetical protein
MKLSLEENQALVPSCVSSSVMRRTQTYGSFTVPSGAKLLIASLLSKREETMKADSFREPGLWWLSCASRPRRMLWNTPGNFSRRPEGNAVYATPGRLRAEWQRAALSTEVAFFLLPNIGSSCKSAGLPPVDGDRSFQPPWAKRCFRSAGTPDDARNLGVLTPLDSLAGPATGRACCGRYE